MTNEQFDEIEKTLQCSEKVQEIVGADLKWENIREAIIEADFKISEETGIPITDLLRWALEASGRIAEQRSIEPEYGPNDPRRG